MKLLAVDTATEVCGVAIVEDGRVTADLSLNGGVTHTRSVMAAVEGLLRTTRLTVSDIDLYAVTRGPGSFTGLRIGISTIKGLAVASAKPMVGVSSLEVVAHQAPEGTPLVCALMDARRNEVYWCLYRRQDNQLVPQSDETVGAAEGIAAHIDDACFFIGNGLVQYRAVIERALQRPAVFADHEDLGIRPAVLARLAWKRFQNGYVDDVSTFAPVYLRKSDAEISRNKSR